MKAWILEEFGGNEKLKISDVPLRKRVQGEVTVDIQFAGVNPVDWKIREGYLKEMFKHNFPLILGWDVAGVVTEAVESSKFKKGDKVYSYIRKPEVGEGAFAQSVNLPEDMLALAPKNIPLSHAAGIPLVALTAFQAITEAGGAKKGQSILIINSSGGVGSFAVQIAKILGLEVTAVCSKGQFGYASSLGADLVVAHDSATVLKELKTLKPGGFEIVLDLYGGKQQNSFFDVIKENFGTFVSIVDTPNAKLSEIHKVTGKFHFVYPSQSHLNTLTDWIESGELKMPPTQVFSILDAQKALTLSQSGGVNGKIVLDISKF